VVDDQSDGDERLDDRGILAETVHRRTHRGKIDEERDAGEVLKKDPGDHERHLRRALPVWLPSGERPDVLFPDPPAVHAAQDRLEHDPQAHGQARYGAEARALGLFGAPSFVTRGEVFWGDDRLEDAVRWHAKGTLQRR